MSERVPSIVERTTSILDAVTVFSGKSIFEGWEDLQLTRELNAIAGDFTFNMTDKWKAEQEPFHFQKGQPIHIHVGKQSIFQGYVETIEPSISASSRTFSIGGRSKTCDLVDCSADPAQYKNFTLKQLADKLCAPFNLIPLFKTDPGAPFDTITVAPGDTVFATLDKHARQRKILVYPSYNGNPVFASQGEGRCVTPIRQGFNMKSGRGKFSDTNRFSHYKVNAQNLGFLGGPEQNIQSQGEARDEGITRYRPLILTSETSADDKTAKDRAIYEAHLRASKADDIQVQLQGWFQEDGSLWEVNRLVRVDSGFLGVRREMLIKKIVFTKNGSGTLSDLYLTRNDAFLFGEKVKKEDPLGWAKPLTSGAAK